MPGSLSAWYSLYDLDTFAERGVTLRGEVEVRKLTRLREILHSERGSIQASLEFHRDANDSVMVDLSFQTDLEFICQRCLEPFVLQVSDSVALTLLEAGSMTGSLAEQGDAVVLVEGRLNPCALLEDELIVALPIIPRHAELEECGDMAQALQALTPEEWSGTIGAALRGR